MTDWREDRIGAALRGDNPTVLKRLPGSFAVIGDVQWLPGYCVLLTDDPSVQRLSDLSPARRRQFLDAMADLGEAVERACRELDPGFRRVNLEILGNTDPYLHAHIWPRYEWEPAAQFRWATKLDRRKLEERRDEVSAHLSYLEGLNESSVG